MLFTIIANLIGLGVVGALVSAVVKKDRANRDDATPAVGPDAVAGENQGTTAGSGA